jgi:hypothetical protein
METVSRARIGAAILLVGAGAVLAVSGTEGAVRLWEGVIRFGPYAVLAAGLLGVLASFAPRSIDPGPLLLVLIGAILIVWQWDWLPVGWPHLTGVLALGLGGWVMTTAPRRAANLDPVLRARAVVFPARPRLPDTAPDYLAATAVGARLTLDLRAAGRPSFSQLELAVSCWLGGSVDVHLPEHWAVVCGRSESTHGVKLHGRVDSEMTIPYVNDPAGATKLDQAARDRLKSVGAAEGTEPVAVLLHLTGVLGRVTLMGR